MSKSEKELDQEILKKQEEAKARVKAHHDKLQEYVDLAQKAKTAKATSDKK